MNSHPVHYRPGGHTGKHAHRYSEVHALDSPAVCQKGPEQQHPRINYAGHLDLVSNAVLQSKEQGLLGKWLIPWLPFKEVHTHTVGGQVAGIQEPPERAPSGHSRTA